MEEQRPAPPEAMNEPERETARFIALFMLGVALFSPLIIAIFDVPGVAVFGVPLLYVYLFASWAALIGLSAWLSRRIDTGSAPPRPPAPGV